MKILSWNVATIRKFSNFKYLESSFYNIIALQEIRYNNLPDLKANYKLPNYYDYWSVSKTKGYSGCVLYVKDKPYKTIIDDDGRYIILFYKDYYVINVYVMNSGEKLQRLKNRIEWDTEFKLLRDFNCSHTSIDVKSPETKLYKPGYTIEERTSFSNLLSEFKLTDTFRYLHPNLIKYSYFSYRNNSRARNHGWRLDYVLVSSSLNQHIKSSDIHTEIKGSDHVPISCELNIFLNELDE